MGEKRIHDKSGGQNACICHQLELAEDSHLLLAVRKPFPVLLKEPMVPIHLKCFRGNKSLSELLEAGEPAINVCVW